MEIIPVIDLMHGQVVHARLGQRQHYQPMQSPLCGSSTPIDIINALLELYPFEQLYIADLAAIQGLSNHFKAVQAIQKAFPQLEVWLDSGIANISDLHALSDLAVSHVIGSENIASIDDFKGLKKSLGNRWMLSLDFTTQGFIGPNELLADHELWPDKIIAMTLYKVGSHQGVDSSLLESLKQKKPSCSLYAAGGVRNLDDLKEISNIGIAGALIASALHQRQLSSADIRYASSSL